VSFGLAHGDLAEVEDRRGEHCVGAAPRHTLDEVIQRPHSPARDHRDVDRVDDRGGHLDVESVAGAVAISLSARPDLNWVQVSESLRETCVRIDAGQANAIGQWKALDGDTLIDYGRWYGAGRLDVGAAVGLALDGALPLADIYVRENLTDIGTVPSGGNWWASPDIWVRNDADPNFDPRPFPTMSPSWMPAGHQNPEYRDSKTSRPNYVYVRVHNRGDQPSSGTERLRLYQAKASTGLAWDSSWVDNVGPICGADRLLGIEVTKPRRNAKTVATSVRGAYRDAVVAIGSDPNYQYSDTIQYFRK